MSQQRSCNTEMVAGQSGSRAARGSVARGPAPFALAGLWLAGVLAAWAPPGTLAAQAPESRSVQAWVSTTDRTRLLAREPDLAFGPYRPLELHIEVDASRSYQEMVGFGASITDASAWLIQERLGPEAREALLQELFGRPGGLGLDFTRLTIGASDFSRRHYSLDDRPPGEADPDLEHFSIDANRGDVLPVVKRALAINPRLRVMASPWSAPAWMKTSGSLIRGSLRPDAQGAFAEYLTRYVSAYENEGVPIYALTVQNEPHFEPNDYPGMRVDSADRARLIGAHLGPRLAKRHPKVRILDWDHNWDEPAAPMAVLADPVARPYVAGVAWHCYAGAVGVQAHVHETHPDKETYFTECSGGEWEPLKSDGLVWLTRTLVIGATRAWAKGVLFWNLALDEKFGPHLGGCRNCRGVVTIDSTTGELTRNAEYYALAHASRFVRQGARRIESGATGAELDNVAFLNQDGSVALIVANSAAGPRAFSVAFGGAGFVHRLPGKGVATFVWQAGSAKEAAAESLRPPAWPAIGPALAPDPALEARIERIVAGMSLRQKVGQMTQAEIRHASPGDVRTHYLGSVLNGGGSWPGGDKRAKVGDWLALAQRYHEASISTGLAEPVPVLWGTDAVHGHNNVYGATLFPHNIGLGAANDSELVGEIGAAVGRAVRATGIAWVFGPTVAVARDDRWGRTYESFSEMAERVRPLAKAYVSGLQGAAGADPHAIATAKHFIGDGATQGGVDQGLSTVTHTEMTGVHGQGYYGALEAGVQTVMASFSSWRDATRGVEYGKVHGSGELLTEALKRRMGFDGFVVSDWNGIGQVPGCTRSSCARAINAGVDMVMVPEDWKAFIDNTVEQVRRGEIPMARIDDAVRRILRVKLRAGLFARAPSQSAHAGDPALLQTRALARRAVRESLVLLKNNDGVLPVSRAKRVLVVGKSADSVPNQTGGWSLTWQGTNNANADFPAGDTILAGIREAAGAGNVRYSETGRDVDARDFDVVIAVVGETPYAETGGDIPASGTLQHTRRHPEDLAVLEAVVGKGAPVVTVFVTGRPAYVNDLINRSGAFVVAWLPGTEGKGVADLLFRNAAGGITHDFRGTLPFSWPREACQTPLNVGDRDYDPLFAYGYGLRYAAARRVGKLAEPPSAPGCAATAPAPIFRQAPVSPYRLYAAAAGDGWRETSIGADLDAIVAVPPARPALRVSTTQVNTQQDAKRAAWSGPARLYLRSASPVSFLAHARAAGALVFDVEVTKAPTNPVTLSMGCAGSCAAALDITRLLAAPGRRTVKVALSCFAARGADLAAIDEPFGVASDGEFEAAFADIRVEAGVAGDANAVPCESLGAGTPTPRTKAQERSGAMLESQPDRGRLRVADSGKAD